MAKDQFTIYQNLDAGLLVPIQVIFQGTLKLTRLHCVLKKPKTQIGSNGMAIFGLEQKIFKSNALMILNVLVKNLIFRDFNIKHQEMDFMLETEPLSMEGNVSEF